MIELLRTRRSIRKYEKKEIGKDATDILKEALLRCPSSRSINPWTFIFVDDHELLQRLARAREHGSAFIGDAALGIVVCGDETKSDVWVEDCSITAIVAQLTAHSMGLGTCWVQIRNRFYAEGKTSEEYIREVLDIPGHLRVECMIGIGYPAEAKAPVPFEKLDHGKIRYNRY